MAVGFGVSFLSGSPTRKGVSVGAAGNAPPRDPSAGPRVGGTTALGEIGAVVRRGASSLPPAFRRDGVGVGSSDRPTSDISLIGGLVGDAAGTGPWTKVAGRRVTPLEIPPTPDGIAVGADEDTPPRDSSSRASLPFAVDGVDVGATDNPMLLVPWTELLAGFSDSNVVGIGVAPDECLPEGMAVDTSHPVSPPRAPTEGPFVAASV